MHRTRCIPAVFRVQRYTATLDWNNSAQHLFHRPGVYRSQRATDGRMFGEACREYEGRVGELDSARAVGPECFLWTVPLVSVNLDPIDLDWAVVGLGDEERGGESDRTGGWGGPLTDRV